MERSSIIDATRASRPGAQIDLLVDRKDGVVNVCEIKFSDGEFAITKEMADVDGRHMWAHFSEMRIRKQQTPVLRCISEKCTHGRVESILNFATLTEFSRGRFVRAVRILPTHATIVQ